MAEVHPLPCYQTCLLEVFPDASDATFEGKVWHFRGEGMALSKVRDGTLGV